jgi:hypothetical protein
MKVSPYIEWIAIDEAEGISLISNLFNRVMYVNICWPEGSYEKWHYRYMKIDKKKFKKGRSLSKEDLLLELL